MTTWNDTNVELPKHVTQDATTKLYYRRYPYRLVIRGAMEHIHTMAFTNTMVTLNRLFRDLVKLNDTSTKDARFKLMHDIKYDFKTSFYRRLYNEASWRDASVSYRGGIDKTKSKYLWMKFGLGGPRESLMNFGVETPIQECIAEMKAKIKEKYTLKKSRTRDKCLDKFYGRTPFKLMNTSFEAFHHLIDTIADDPLLFVNQFKDDGDTKISIEDMYGLIIGRENQKPRWDRIVAAYETPPEKLSVSIWELNAIHLYSTDMDKLAEIANHKTVADLPCSTTKPVIDGVDITAYFEDSKKTLVFKRPLVNPEHTTRVSISGMNNMTNTNIQKALEYILLMEDTGVVKITNATLHNIHNDIYNIKEKPTFQRWGLNYGHATLSMDVKEMDDLSFLFLMLSKVRIKTHERVYKGDL